MAIVLNGTTGIGVGTTPSHPLDIEVSSGDGVARIHAAENNNASETRLRLEVSNDFAESIVETYDSSGIGGSLKYNHGDNAWRFSTTGDTERMRIDSSGNLLIGTTTPIINEAGFNEIVIGGKSEGAAITLQDADSNVRGGLFSSDANLAMIVRTVTNHPLEFRTNNTSRMLVTSSGFLKAKGNCSSYQSTTGTYHELMQDSGGQTILDMKHNSSNGFGMIMKFNHQSTSNYAFQVYDFANSSERMVVRCDGDLENANNSYGGISDVKLKENIVDAKSQWDDIKALKVRNFNFKADANKTKLLGLVAQEAEEVCPSLVKSQPDLDLERKDLGTETKVLKYSIVYMKAIKALQEAQARIETLETKVAALEAA